MSRTPEAPEMLRKLGVLEKYSVVRYGLGYYSNVIIVAEYELPGTFDSPIKHYVFMACTDLIARHPLLSVIAVENNVKEYIFVRLSEVDLDRCVVFEEMETPGSANKPQLGEDLVLNRMLETQHNTKFNEGPTCPMWRLLIQTNSISPRHFTATFVFHHAIGDGGSGLAFHRTFLTALRRNGPSIESMPGPLVGGPFPPMLPALENALDLGPSYWHLIKQLFVEYVYKPQRAGVWTMAPVQPPTHTKIRHLVLSKETTGALRMAGKKHGVTVHATLQTLLGDSMLSLSPEKFDKVRFAGAMSLRKFIPSIAEDDIGVYVQDWSETYVKHDPSDEGISWQRARQTKKIIEDTLAARGYNCSISMLGYLSDYRSFFLSKMGKPRHATFELSNLGAYRDDSLETRTGGEFPSIKRVYFSQSSNVTGPVIQFSAVTGSDGCLTLVAPWQAGLIGEEDIDLILKDLRARIDRVAGLEG